MTPSVRTLQGSKQKSFRGSKLLCPRGSNTRGFSIHDYYDDRTACHARYPDHTNPYKKKYEFEQILSTFDKKEEDDFLYSFRGTGNIFRDAHNLKTKDAEVRKEAREKYSRKGHMDFLVNCRISEIINKKLEIESRLHIKQAENESYNHSR